MNLVGVTKASDWGQAKYEYSACYSYIFSVSKASRIELMGAEIGLTVWNTLYLSLPCDTKREIPASSLNIQ